jgi:hypothetical protein
MKHYILPILLAALVFYSCKKTVTLDLNTAPSQIVIQGEVTDSAGPYTITINHSVGFYADNSFPALSGAVVRINDGQGVTDSLTETSPGIYSTHFLQGRPGNTYTLTVLAQDTTYTAVSTMPQPVALDSVTFQARSLLKTNQITPVVNFQDPAGVKNYYQFLMYINGALFTKDIFVFDDRLSDGRYISNKLLLDSAYVQSGDQIRVTMNVVDANVYNYFYELSLTSGTGLFNTTADPANPVSNISKGAFGYFSAHTTVSRKATAY